MIASDETYGRNAIQFFNEEKRHLNSGFEIPTADAPYARAPIIYIYIYIYALGEQLPAETKKNNFDRVAVPDHNTGTKRGKTHLVPNMSHVIVV